MLDNVVWHALAEAGNDMVESGPGGHALRYRPDISVFGALEDFGIASWASFGSLVGDTVGVLFGVGIPAAPQGWVELARYPSYQMVIESLPEIDTSAAQPLGPDDAEQMAQLVALTEPGPWSPNTYTLGGYQGVYEGGQLIAMAGLRFQGAGYGEVSAVCVHPDYQGRGLGAMVSIAAAQVVVDRGEKPFLHVLHTNAGAIGLYEALGFTVRSSADAVAVKQQ